MAEESIAFGAVLQGDFAVAESLLDQVLEATTRLRLQEMTHYSLLVKAMIGAHRGRRREMNVALAELRRWGGDNSINTPRAYGLARTWCSLLEENRPRALRELAAARAADERSPSFLQLSGRFGLQLLLEVLEGTAGRPEYREVIAAPPSKLRWERQFCLLADAVLAGREGQANMAAETVAEAVRVGAPYPIGRHLGLRLVSEAAIADGWGTPIDWLRAAEDFFFQREVPAVTSACRALLRHAGAPIYQHRHGTQQLPAALRAVGVTVREHEILQLLRERLTNREIASRLHLSPRTVEKHVASLITKTGQANRITLGEYGSAILD
ncbi:MAG TPA: helix-turn-helix transcriptional regulator [Streptosporangiaceae bacterium]|nr:helix-turn-helix transcriptional regulator [Streptosporangiaceae bacterium]